LEELLLIAAVAIIRERCQSMMIDEAVFNLMQSKD